MEDQGAGGWDAEKLNKIDARFAHEPGPVSEARRITREVISYLPELSGLESAILEWDRRGRRDSERSVLGEKAWDGVRDGIVLDWRGRLFAGLVTSDAVLDDIEARSLLDTAISLGVPADEIESIFNI